MNGPNSPAQSPLARLLAGNARFAAGAPVHPHQSADRRAGLTAEQAPCALVLSCSDSRVPPEVVFDQGLGDLFTVRTAGHVVDDTVAATLAFGIGVLKVPLLVVLGHEQCGAVTAALESEARASGPLAPLLARIRPALGELPAGAADDNLLEAAVRANVRHVAGEVRVMAASLMDTPPPVAGAYYHLQSGRIEIIDDGESG